MIGSDVVDARRAAARFFWCWLIVATAMSVAGNVAHALLIAPAATRWMAAVAALVPPAVLISANHSISVLYRTRVGGGAYWVALLATIVLALGAFVLSFDALRSLAVVVGFRPSIAWIWPAVIDVAIGHATLCLLSLSRPRRSTSPAGTLAPRGEPALSPTSDVRIGVQTPAPPSATPAAFSVESEVGGATAATPGVPSTMQARALAAVPAASSSPPEGRAGIANCPDPAVIRRWRPHADSLLASTRMRQKPEVIAAVLAQRADGKRATSIAALHNIPTSTVQRILTAADKVLGAVEMTG
ncbi:DUF2637 domain-containing protein [Mycobacterium sp. 155]|uniref:DUF2637 domain-containing protein n=1 Tax=Mycobacterium sp. 155 TaxID=1157943 RepID=UPI00036739B6|nr:DUF2637 domain-containing protein [Mycobacterium sp. 155]